METEKNEMMNSTEDKEPIYFVPKRVNLVSDVAGIFSWIVLVVTIGDIVVQVIYTKAQMVSQNLTLATLISKPSFLAYFFVNLVIPLVTGLGLFAILQAAASGLNVLLEMDFNAREAKSKAKA